MAHSKLEFEPWTARHAPFAVACMSHTCQTANVSAVCAAACRAWCGLNRGMRLTPELEAQLPGRQQLCVGLGSVTAGRRQLFKQQQGLAVEMVQRAFDVTPCNGED